MVWYVWTTAPNAAKLPEFRDGDSIPLSSDGSHDLGVCCYKLVHISECEMKSITILSLGFSKSPRHAWRKPCSYCPLHRRV